MSIIVNVKNDCMPVWSSDSAVYFPQLYQIRSTDHHQCGDPSIEFIDVVETWKGLQPDHAQELRFWQNALVKGITNLVEEALISSYESAGFQLDSEGDDPMQIMEKLDDMHEYTKRLGHQTLKCNIDKLIDHMWLCHELSERSHDWLGWERSNALANFIQLHHCFPQDERALHVLFSCDQRHPMELQAFVEIFSYPHIFHLDHAPSAEYALPWFRAPVLDERKRVYPVDISDAIQCKDPSMWKMTVATRFPDGVRFERVYRFRHHAARPICLLIQRPQKKQSRKQGKSRSRSPAKLRVSHDNPLRALSNGDVRVQGNGGLPAQGVTDLELEARTAHRGFYDTHRDQSIGKNSLLAKIYGTPIPPQENQAVNMLHATSSPHRLTDTHRGSIRKQEASPSSHALQSSPSPMRTYRSLPGTIAHPNEDLVVHQFVESVRFGRFDDNPFVREELTSREAAKVISWANEVMLQRAANLKSPTKQPSSGIKLKLRMNGRPRRPPHSVTSPMDGFTDMESFLGFSPAVPSGHGLFNLAQEPAPPGIEDITNESYYASGTESDVVPLIPQKRSRREKGKAPMRDSSAVRDKTRTLRMSANDFKELTPYIMSPSRPLVEKWRAQSPTQRLEKKLKASATSPWGSFRDVRVDSAMLPLPPNIEASSMESSGSTGKKKRMAEETPLDEETLEQLRLIDEAVERKEQQFFERIFMDSTTSLSTAEISPPESADKMDVESDLDLADRSVSGCSMDQDECK